MKRKDILKYFLILSTFIVFISIFGKNFLETVSALVLLNILVYLFYYPNQPLVIIAGLFIQFLSITITVFQANLIGIDFTQLHQFRFDIKTTYYLSLIGLLAYSLGLYVMVKPLIITDNFNIETIKRLNVKKVFWLYVGLTFITIFFRDILWIIPGVTQIGLAFLSVKWGIFTILFIFVLVTNKIRKIFTLLITFEVLMGFTLYFSAYKEVLIFSIILLMSFGHLIKKIKPLYVVLIASTVILLSVIWMTIRSDYRYYLSGGKSAQIVTVSKLDALNYLFGLVTDIKTDDMKYGLEFLAYRITYIDFFSAAVSYTPGSTPHTNGEILFKSVMHILTPRLIFSGKGALDDSELLNYYAGLKVAGAKQGTSISLGYMGESYIDFGPFLMFVPIFILGLLTGFLIKYIFKRSKNFIYYFTFVTPFFNFVNINGMSYAKILGSMLMYFIVITIILRFFQPLLERTFFKK